jgi:hypothetical protein
MFLTYELKTQETLHNIFRGRAGVVSCDMFGSSLYRAASPIEGSIVNTLSNAQKTVGTPFRLVSKVCFALGRNKTNRKRDRVLKIGSVASKCEVLAKFCATAGLKIAYEQGERYAKVTPVEDLFIKGIKQINTFIIAGTFEVVDRSKFEDAYNHGVGKRRTYGCGMLVVL